MTMEPEIRKTSTAMAQGEARTAAAEAAAQARLAWPDWIRGAAMIGVISVHVSGVSGFPDNPLLLWLNSFVMAVFFFVSGSLMRNSRECSAAEYARRKAAAILWPYLTFSACAVLFDIAVLKLQGGNITRDLIRLWLRCVFTLVGRGTLWFLPVFYFACVLAWIVRNRRIPAVLLFLAGLAVMAFMNEIFGATVAVLTGGGDGIGSDIYLVAIRSLAAAAVILEGFWTGPLLDRLTLSKYGTPAALLSFAVSLLIPVFYRMDFRTARFGRYPVFLFVSAAAAYIFLRWCAEKLSRLSVLTYFGKNSLILMATHLEWYLVHLAWGGVISVVGTAADFGPGYLARHLAALMLVLMTEYSLCGLIHHCFGFLMYFPSRKKAG